ncbi:MAG: FecR domain-containing protein [Bacteroidales bacterium]|nr:FecR domain-containing protein [Bacteroidales bacterium]
MDERENISFRQIRALMALRESDGDDPDKNWRGFVFRRRCSSFFRAAVRVAPLLLAVVLAAGIFYLPPRTSALEGDSLPYLTTSAPAGHMAACVLPDGTEVKLNANSKLTYPALFGDERKVYLEGEAFFDVTSDKSCPFIVSTDKLEVKALGTKFNISDYKNDNFVVSLLEGSVFLYQDGMEETGLYLNPNEQLVESEGGYVKKMFVQDPAMWVNGFYSFNNNTMEYILSKLELYYDVRIVVLNGPLLNKTYTGKFRQTDGAREILRIMSRIYPFTVREDESSNTIYIQ